MQRIATIEYGDVPLRLSELAMLNVTLPPAVAAHVARGQWWHLVAWSDSESNTLGLWCRAAAVVFPTDRIWGFDIELLGAAKFSGFVRLDAALDGKRGGANMLESHYKKHAEDWLLGKKSQLSEIFGHRIDVNYLGTDY
ncbi:hypothetical protein [Ralstonia sp. UBA689]|uniref:hypothetical protein n=1 Tax=Ralstonia sp. UBA689 TaxID=1947373 RepID=UPI0025DDE6B6|nr:hypothetical protein [Ralstonia sp. UBA689]